MISTDATPQAFTKSFTQQEPIADVAMQAVAAVLHTGRLHRYNVDAGEESEAAALEREYAAW